MTPAEVSAARRFVADDELLSPARSSVFSFLRRHELNKFMICEWRVSNHLSKAKAMTKLTIDGAVAIKIGMLDHFVNLIIGMLLAQRDEHGAQLARGDRTASVLVEDFKSCDEFVFRTADGAGRSSHDLEEFWRRRHMLDQTWRDHDEAADRQNRYGRHRPCLSP